MDIVEKVEKALNVDMCHSSKINYLVGSLQSDYLKENIHVSLCIRSDKKHLLKLGKISIPNISDNISVEELREQILYTAKLEHDEALKEIDVLRGRVEEAFNICLRLR